MATRVAQRRNAPRWNGRSGVVVLSDSMLNVKAGLGELILDTIAATFTTDGIALDRIRRPQIGDHRPQEWINHLVARRVSALVVTAGDCATCTSRALRECVLAEHSGIPATAVVPVGLNEIIHATLEAWGRPCLKVATFDTPLFAIKRSDFPDVMQKAAKHVKVLLTS
jgi:hypothetical protein